MPARRPSLGRVEQAVDRELRERTDVGAAEKAALRAQARAVDVAEQDRDVEAVSKANAVYLDLRQAAGMSAGNAKPVDAIDELLAELLRPEPNTGHAAE